MPMVSCLLSAKASLSLVPTPSVPGDQHRLAVALRQLDQRAEAADAGQHLRAQRAPGERLDRLDQRVAGVDIDAGVAIRERGRGRLGESMQFGARRLGWRFGLSRGEARGKVQRFSLDFTENDPWEPAPDRRRDRRTLAADPQALRPRRLGPIQYLWIVGAALILALLLHWLGPILTPFLIGAIIAYLGSPAVAWAERRRVPRTLGTLIAIVVILRWCSRWPWRSCLC